jgi:hypothetical protein
MPLELPLKSSKNILMGLFHKAFNVEMLFLKQIKNRVSLKK